jgi:hypothetical protein
MKPYPDTAPTVERVKLHPRQAVGIKLEAILTWVAAVAVAAGALFLASELHEPRILALCGVAGVLAVRAHLLWREVHDGPTVARRVWWRFVAWRTARAMRPRPSPKPYRAVRVAGVDEAVKLPRQAGEMRSKQESKVPGLRYSASDVYMIVCAAYTSGLSERGWTFGESGFELPSGDRLSRDGFREVQAWLVTNGFARSKPVYAFLPGATPETVLEKLA